MFNAENDCFVHLIELQWSSRVFLNEMAHKNIKSFK